MTPMVLVSVSSWCTMCSRVLARLGDIEEDATAAADAANGVSLDVADELDDDDEEEEVETEAAVSFFRIDPVPAPLVGGGDGLNSAEPSDDSFIFE